ncbi:helix-turn-helix transcriptional regulator, partial [Solirubrobacter taibaiensis]|nr:helix-turn-helix transcriptional regulator [Solirubrobacter taibaiensis]
AAALAAAGASAAARAHHVERYARLGDLEAVAVLRAAGLAADQALPATAAHWFAAALAVLPQDAEDERLGLLIAHARAQAQVGNFAAARTDLLAALNLKGQALYVRPRMIAGCATAERLMGRFDEARARVEQALAELPDRATSGGLLLMAELATDGFLRTDWALMWEWGRKGLAVSRTLDDPPALAASTAFAALADAFVGLLDDAHAHCDAAARLVDSLPDEQFAQRVDAGLHLMGAELYLDRVADALRHGQRALDVGRATGQGLLFPILVPALGACYEISGRIAESVALLDDAIEAARLNGNRQALSLALMNRCATAVSAGDIDAARAFGEEAVSVARELDNQLAGAFAGFTLAQALAEAGEPERAVALELESGGGPDLPRMPYAWRGGGFELLARCGAPGAAERCVEHAEQTGLANAIAHATGLHDPLAAAELTEAAGAPVYAARLRVRAAAQLDKPQAIEQLERAAQTFERCGATKRREAAERELRRLGRTVYRRSESGALEDLTARELELARLVVDRLTNAQIAETLFLSKKTVETHLRNIFAKVGVSSRVELARAVERADRAGQDGGAASGKRFT